MLFPQVSGSNLEGKRYRLPQDLEGDVNLLFIPFQRWHQEWVDTWAPFARQLEQELPGFRFYELPTLPRMNPLYRLSLDWGMKAGIPDKATREATITLYLDKEAYRKSLAIPDEETIIVLLVTRAGEILWRTEGPFAPGHGEALRQVLHTQQP